MQGPIVDTNKRPHRSHIFGQRIVKQRFQFWLSFAVFLIMSISCALSWYAGKLYIDHLLSSGLAANANIASYLKTLNIIVGMTSVLVLCAGVLTIVLFSHSIAGPILRFEWALDRLKEGDLTHHIRLRKGDQFTDVANRFNETFDVLRRRMSAQRLSVEEIRKELLGHAEKARGEGRADEAARFEHHAAELDKILGGLKLG